jgi:hypothetical protein
MRRPVLGVKNFVPPTASVNLIKAGLLRYIWVPVYGQVAGRDNRGSHQDRGSQHFEDWYAPRLGGKQGLNEMFRAVNMHLRFKHRDKFRFDVAAWEALGPGFFSPLDRVLEERELTSLWPLIYRLEKEFASIEYALYCLYMLPKHIR